jgi:hypothetical protein
VAGNGLQNKALFWNYDMVSGLPYDVSNCSRIECTVIEEFHPVMFGMFDNLNWLAMLLFSMQKHARLMMTKER